MKNVFVYFDASENFQRFASTEAERISTALGNIIEEMKNVFECDIFHIHIHDKEYYSGKESIKKNGNECRIHLSLVFDQNLSTDVISKIVIESFKKFAPKGSESFINKLEEALK